MKMIGVFLTLVGIAGWFLDSGQVLAGTARHSPKSGASIQWIGPGNFEEAILTALRRRFGRPHHQVTLRVLSPQKAMQVPKGRLHLEMAEFSRSDQGRTGRRSFRVGVYVNKQFVKNINVVGEIKAKANVATPVRWMKPKEVVVADDLAMMTVDVPSLSHDFFLDLQQIVGKQVLRSLPPRQPIRKIMLDDPPVIRKGDRVIIEVRQGGLLVQTVGLAKASGKSGDTISVKNQNSGRDVLGTVSGAGLVQVGF